MDREPRLRMLSYTIAFLLQRRQGRTAEGGSGLWWALHNLHLYVCHNECLIIAGQYSLLDEFIKRIGGGSFYWVIKLYGRRLWTTLPLAKIR